MLGAVVQARMSSRRFPGKVLLPLAGQPMLTRVVNAASQGAGAVVVATSTDSTDDPVEALCRAEGFAVYRGALRDVAGRVASAAEAAGFSVIARVSADSPFLRASVVAAVVGLYRAGDADVATNVRPRSFPAGQSVEVVATDALVEAAGADMTDVEREHVLPWFYSRPDRYVVRNVLHEPDLSAVPMTVDEPHDLEVLERVAIDLADRLDTIDLVDLAAAVTAARVTADQRTRRR